MICIKPGSGSLEIALNLKGETIGEIHFKKEAVLQETSAILS